MAATAWVAGQKAMNEHLRREVTPWEPAKLVQDTQSTYSSHYRAWPVQRQGRAQRPKDARPPSAGAFDTRSTAQDSFQSFAGHRPPKSFRPQSAYTPTTWMQPLSTTHREAFQQWRPMPRQGFKPKERQRDADGDYTTGRTTSQDAYPAHMAVMTRSCKPTEKVLDPMPFDGTTTSRAAFLQWPMPPKYERKVPEVATAFQLNEPFPSSTYRDMFREIKVPMKHPCALGLQVVGGNFYQMMARGTVPPCAKKAMMTTVLDNQPSVDIVVVLSETEKNSRGKVLGEFTLDGIQPTAKGVPQVEVTLNLDTNNMLRVTAHDVQGNRARALTVTEKVRLL